MLASQMRVRPQALKAQTAPKPLPRAVVARASATKDTETKEKSKPGAQAAAVCRRPADEPIHRPNADSP
jgi:hypothetical protein